MARIRTVKPDFFRHETLFECEQKSALPVRLAFAGLWTAADREGRFVWSPRALKLDCLPYDDVDFAAVLDALAEYGFICKYEVDGKQYGYIPAWSKHQHVNQREAQSILPDPAHASTCNNIPAHGEGKGREVEGKGKGGTRESTRPSPEAFEKFKSAYPMRGGSNPWKPAEDLFLKAIRDGTEAESLIRAAESYAGECSRQKITGTEKVAQAQTWLTEERWRDYRPPDAADMEAIERDMRNRGYEWNGEKWVACVAA